MIFHDLTFDAKIFCVGVRNMAKLQTTCFCRIGNISFRLRKVFANEPSAFIVGK
jgi:hypothetical protein